MTEAKWLACTDLRQMWEFLNRHHPISSRKWTLFACACRCEVDENPCGDEIQAVAEACVLADAEPVRDRADPAFAVSYAVHQYTSAIMNGVFARQSPAKLATQAALLRDIAGNPFRTALIPHVAGKDSALFTLTQTIYSKWSFDSLPTLADALEEAGCTNEEILTHCRGPGPHFRGCWVVDLILGKK